MLGKLPDPVDFCKSVRDSFYGSTHIYTQGSCYFFYEILRSVYGDDAVPYCDSGHVVTKINGKFYDITGEVSDNDYKPYAECSAEYRFHERPLNAFGEVFVCPRCEEWECAIPDFPSHDVIARLQDTVLIKQLFFTELAKRDCPPGKSLEECKQTVPDDEVDCELCWRRAAGAEVAPEAVKKRMEGEQPDRAVPLLTVESMFLECEYRKEKRRKSNERTRKS